MAFLDPVLGAAHQALTQGIFSTQIMKDRPQGLSRDSSAPQIAADAEAYLDRTGIRIIVVGADRTGKYERGIFF